MDPSTAATPAPRLGALVLSLAPGLLLAAAVAFSADRVGGWEASLSQLWLGRPVAIAPPVIALLIGIALHGVAARPQFTPGSSFAIKKVLRWAIALFGLNIAFADIRGLGLASAAMVILTMIATLAAGLLFARLFRLGDAFGALAGAASAVCGA
ncbi:MAG: putative sulfate exporter family transporter, partial [Roseiarcus sp.]